MEFTALAWTAHDLQLVAWGGAALVAIIVLISVVRLPPFLSILIGAIGAGLGMGASFEAVGKSFSKGAGGILGDAGLIIALGAMLGAMLAESGAADRIAGTMLRHAKGRALPWIMAVVAMVIGLPLFFEVGLVLMMPIIFVMAKRSQQPLVTIAVPALAGMTTLHALVPPHPGPLIAVSALHADLGMTMLFGLLIAVPVVILAGPLYALWLAPRMKISAPKDMEALFQSDREHPHQPAFWLSLLTVLLPVMLMLGRTFARLVLAKDAPAYQVLDFLGEPIIALTLAVLFAAAALGWAQGMARSRVSESLRKSLGPIAALLLTIGAGGGLKQILLDAGISDTISKVATGAHVPLLLLAWLIAVALRQATGSATVATTTSAGILAGTAGTLSPAHASLVALAIGAGSVFFCHVNDAGFWMVREYFGLKLRQTLMMWSVLQTIVSVVGLAGTFVLWAMLT